jgi:hypothetical protein
MHSVFSQLQVWGRCEGVTLRFVEYLAECDSVLNQPPRSNAIRCLTESSVECDRCLDSYLQTSTSSTPQTFRVRFQVAEIPLVDFCIFVSST